MNLPSQAKIRADLSALLESAGEPPAIAAIDLLLIHVQMLARWNERFNLTRITSWPGILDRHLRESLLPLRWIGETGQLLDVGSGNGFPAIPILACRGRLKGVLVERSEKKSLFLEALLREAGRDNVRVETRDIRARSEVGTVSEFDYVVGRASLPPARYLEVALSRSSQGGRVFLFAGGEAKALLAAERGRLELLGSEPIPGRRDSFLFVIQRIR